MTAQLTLDFVLIPGGEFLMGTDLAAYRAAGADELPQHGLPSRIFTSCAHP